MCIKHITIGTLLLVLLTACNMIRGNSTEESSIILLATSNAVPSQVNTPIITVFTSSTSIIWLEDIDTVDVSWTVQNRPENSNLVFEQVLANGTVRNAELPREVAYVASNGSGMLLPVLSDNADETITFQIRLIDLANNQTLASKQLVISTATSAEWTGVEVNQDSCYETPFFPSNDIRIGSEGRVQLNGQGNLDVYETLEYNTIVTSLDVGDTFLVEAGPDCLYMQAQNYAMRRWFINTGNTSGWVDEYFYGFPMPASYYFIPSNQGDIPTIEMMTLSMSPSTINGDAIATTDFTFTWATSNTSLLFFEPSFIYEEDLASSGSLVVSGADLLNTIDANSSSQTFNLIAYDTQSNSQTLSTTLIID